jgi:ParB/RepB/Spo0J family partition protein
MSNQVLELTPDQIDITGSKNYSRYKSVSEEKVNEIAESFRTYGQQNPIIVFQNGSDKYYIEQGFTRYAAALKAEMPVILARLSEHDSEEDRFASNLEENLRRAELSNMDKAAMVQNMKKHGWTPTLIGKKLGVTDQSVAQYMKLNKLPENVRDLVHIGKISLADAVVLTAMEKALVVAAIESCYEDVKNPEVEGEVKREFSVEKFTKFIRQHLRLKAQNEREARQEAAREKALAKAKQSGQTQEDAAAAAAAAAAAVPLKTKKAKVSDIVSLLEWARKVDEASHKPLPHDIRTALNHVLEFATGAVIDVEQTKVALSQIA